MLLRASLQLREIKGLIITKSISCWSGISMLSQFLLSKDRYLHPSGELGTRAGHHAVPAGSDPGLSRGECPCPRSASSFLVRKAKREEELVGKLSWPRGCGSPGSTVLAVVFHLCSIFPVGDLLQGLLLHHGNLQGNAQLMVFKAGSSVF